MCVDDPAPDDAKTVPVVVATTLSDDLGEYRLGGLPAGGVLIAANVGPTRIARIYYPGVQSEDLAVVVELGQAEKRSDINFQVPNPTAP